MPTRTFHLWAYGSRQVWIRSLEAWIRSGYDLIFGDFVEIVGDFACGGGKIVSKAYPGYEDGLTQRPLSDCTLSHTGRVGHQPTLLRLDCHLELRQVVGEAPVRSPVDEEIDSLVAIESQVAGKLNRSGDRADDALLQYSVPASCSSEKIGLVFPMVRPCGPPTRRSSGYKWPDNCPNRTGQSM